MNKCCNNLVSNRRAAGKIEKEEGYAMNIAVFCGSTNGNRPSYIQVAKELGTYIGDTHKGLVYGASDCGLMGVLARAAYEHGACIHGVGLEMFESTIGSFECLSDIYVAKTFGERKSKMISMSDAFVALPGGSGTLDEVSDILCVGNFDCPNKPIIFLNVDGYYEDLKNFLYHAVDEGFILAEHMKRVFFISSIEELPEILD